MITMASLGASLLQGSLAILILPDMQIWQPFQEGKRHLMLNQQAYRHTEVFQQDNTRVALHQNLCGVCKCNRVKGSMYDSLHHTVS